MAIAVIRWTARIALLLYASALVLTLSPRFRPSYDRQARLLYTLGCVIFLAHVVAVFHFVHHWSHAAAYRETARQTAVFFHLDPNRGAAHLGAGLYLNYAFTLLWTADALYWWAVGPDVYRRRLRRLTLSLHAFLLFLAFNATVVFVPPPARWIGASLWLLLIYVFVRRRPATV